MTEKEMLYRKTHGVVPCLDTINNGNCLSLLPSTTVVHTKFAAATKLKGKISAGKIAGGIGSSLIGVMHLATGDIGYGLGKMASGAIGATVGSVDSESIAIESGVINMIAQQEVVVWSEYDFLRRFEPAQGNLGDIFLADGSADEFHTGNGYRIYENGDYFEGYWEDGEIAWGVYLWESGERYLGRFCNGTKQRGINIFPDGSYYNGTMFDNVRHGVGCMWYVDGVYFGEWYRDMRHGQGMARFENGTCFHGDWQDDVPVA